MNRKPSAERLLSFLFLLITLGVVLCVVGSRKFGRQRVGEENGGNN